jgi:hypothetical protein
LPLLLFLLALLAPYVLSLPTVRNRLLAYVARDCHGDVRVGDLSLGWFSPIAVRDLQMSLPDGDPVVELPLLAGNKPLWQLLSDRHDVDHFRLEGAKLNLVFDAEGGSNLKKLLPPIERPTEEELRRAIWRRFGGQLRIVDAAFTVDTPRSDRPWSVHGINLTVTLHPQTAVPESSPVVVLERGTLLSHTPVTREMCNDALKYIAPVLANATWAEGEISIDIDRCRLPIDNARKGDVAGRFSIHKVEAGSTGPVVMALANLLKVNPRVSLAENSIVRFELRDGRVHHRDLEFGLESARVRTSGSVGLDHTLDLNVDLPIPVSWISERPAVQALSEQRITVTVKGTLEQPRIEAAGLAKSGLAALRSSGILAGDANQGLIEEGVTATAALLGQWLKNRAEGQGILQNGVLGRRRRQARDEPQPDVPPSSERPPEVQLPQPSVKKSPSVSQSPPAAEPASTEPAEEVTANKPSLDEPREEPRRFRIFDRRRERREADPD